MNSLLNILLVPAAAIIPPIALVVLILWDRRRKSQTEKPPQSEKLLRPPGYSLYLKLDDTIDQLVMCLLQACGLSIVAALGAELALILVRGKAPVIWTGPCVIFTGLFLGLSVVSVIRGFKKHEEAENIRLGLRGEQAVGEALNYVSPEGFHSFHDLKPTDDTNWNIDHVTVSTRGVFLIETKARRRRSGNKNQMAHEVVHTGAALQFPSYQTTEPIDQAQRNSKWLEDYLTKFTGEPVTVMPLVVLPGLFIKPPAREQTSPVKVMNAKYLIGYLQDQSEKITPAQVRRIIARLDEKCRTLEF